MDRVEKILRHVDKAGFGMEIGPSHNPIVPKKKGYKVHIVDHTDREGLINKYKDDGVNLNNIEDVDFIWKGESYSELTGKHKYYDWIIGSHIVEHIPDLISFFKDCDSILKDEGVVSLAVPDKRYCFDHYRPISGLSKIIDNHFQKANIHTPGTVAEYYLNVVKKNGNIGWFSNTVGEYEFIHSLENAIQKMDSVVTKKTYLDLHAWCFVPHSFRLIIHDLYQLGMIPFQELDFFYTVGSEFYITLSRIGKGLCKSRMEMLNTIESELQYKEFVNELKNSEQISFSRQGEIKQLEKFLQKAEKNVAHRENELKNSKQISFSRQGEIKQLEKFLQKAEKNAAHRKNELKNSKQISISRQNEIIRLRKSVSKDSVLIARLRQSLEQSRQHIRAVEHSISCRLGWVLTFPLRLLRDIIRGNTFQKNNKAGQKESRQTSTGKQQRAESIASLRQSLEHSRQHIRAVEHSISFRLGWVLTFPLRLLRDISINNRKKS